MLKCRFWFSRSGLEPKTLHFCTRSQAMHQRGTTYTLLVPVNTSRGLKPQWFSQCGTWTSRISITWRRGRNASPPASPQTSWTRNWGWSPAVCALISLPGDSDAHWYWRTSGFEKEGITAASENQVHFNRPAVLRESHGNFEKKPSYRGLFETRMRLSLPRDIISSNFF